MCIYARIITKSKNAPLIICRKQKVIESVLNAVGKILDRIRTNADVLLQDGFVGKMKRKPKNYGKRIVDIYIYELGNLSELVDVRFKPYSQRIKEIAPQLLLERRCDTANVVEALATKRTSLKSALAEEGTNFQTVIVEVRKEILIDAIKKGLSIKEIYPLLGYPEPSNVYWFAKRFLGMSFNDFYRKTRKEI